LPIASAVSFVRRGGAGGGASNAASRATSKQQIDFAQGRAQSAGEVIHGFARFFLCLNVERSTYRFRRPAG
jgi:hypothetical protein